MQTAIDALARLEPQAVADSDGKSSIQKLIDEMAAKFDAFEVGCARLEAEPDIEKRRALNDGSACHT